MRPCTRKVRTTAHLLQNISSGPIIAKIQGSTKKLGELNADAIVVLYSKENMQPVAIQKPDPQGHYQFQGLNTELRCFVIGFDNKQQYNAVIQDNVVPK
ncbi:hypothetical protein F946_01344 [Acinetobacter johnsonii ANC 3681]|uniref:Carboxypeptidase regulatory-like domain-containing protein n=1 Tax=Acinetobacter johnsonii ANC 3681 TaxID=1217662 RepID=N9CMZ4_ACIJO|nr:hypothetical protein [Acinetobacter johnsonii]ENV71889.1 hypothetical protein F946_01344 [Acinetobacter johnsonii ANC 3681]